MELINRLGTLIEIINPGNGLPGISTYKYVCVDPSDFGGGGRGSLPPTDKIVRDNGTSYFP